MLNGNNPFEVCVVKNLDGENEIGFTSEQRAIEYIERNYPDWVKNPRCYIDFLIVNKFD